jgi:cellulose synthase/poly-beta-1,6-N-acetylglucosamine synthase-like glycosyltransferase
MNVSIVVPAYNEAKNIRRLLSALLEQETRRARIVEIVVVASGCTDDTAEVARDFGRGRPGMHVHVQERREGKVAAVNAYFKARDPRAEVTLVCSADVDPARDVVEKLCSYLADHPEVGMVGGRPVPDNDPSRFVGRMVRLLWELHHRVSLEVPKMGEIVAFRSHLVEYVSELSVVDEASIEDIVRAKGYQLGYVPDALVTNHGPETLREYFEQRRRIARGHYWLEFAFGYEVATLDRGLVVRSALDTARAADRRGKLALAAAVGTEVVARAVGFWDARVLGGKHRTWNVLASTKTLATQSNGAPPRERPHRVSARPDPLDDAARKREAP